mmetsp:Transcript_76797/g.238504  ORF Transcript_76797/g.238504 Transcript_76797/m.238504 type:complete len:231 (-) Transcript_76797:94-786(-)
MSEGTRAHLSVTAAACRRTLRTPIAARGTGASTAGSRRCTEAPRAMSTTPMSMAEKAAACRTKQQCSVACDALRSKACSTFHVWAASCRNLGSSATRTQKVSTAMSKARQTDTKHNIRHRSTPPAAAKSTMCAVACKPSAPPAAAAAAPQPQARMSTAASQAADAIPKSRRQSLAQRRSKPSRSAYTSSNRLQSWSVEPQRKAPRAKSPRMLPRAKGRSDSSPKRKHCGP